MACAPCARAPRARGRSGLAEDRARRASPRSMVHVCVQRAMRTLARARTRRVFWPRAASRAWVTALGWRAVRVCMDTRRLIEVTTTDGGRVAASGARLSVCVCRVLCTGLHRATRRARLSRRAGAHVQEPSNQATLACPRARPPLPIAHAVHIAPAHVASNAGGPVAAAPSFPVCLQLILYLRIRYKPTPILAPPPPIRRSYLSSTVQIATAGTEGRALRPVTCVQDARDYLPPPHARGAFFVNAVPSIFTSFLFSV